MNVETCEHVHVRPEVCDQTLGVLCEDCLTLAAVCWAEDHIPESMWNRACANAEDPDWVPSKQSRDDVCAICGETLEKRSKE